MRIARPLVLAAPLWLPVACAEESHRGGPNPIDGGPNTGGTSSLQDATSTGASAGNGGDAGLPTAGSGGANAKADASDASAAAGNGGSTMDGGSLDGGSGGLSTIVSSGIGSISQSPRPAYGAMVVANDGERSYVVESRRDVETGPFSLPWRSRFRIAAYDSGVEAWAYAIDPDDNIGDVVVHPSGDVTFSLQRFPPARMAYELVRLGRNGNLIASTALSEPTTVPNSDFGPNDPRPLFRMKSDVADAFTAGWVRLLADGEGLIVAFLSFVDLPETDISSTRLALGLGMFAWQANAYVERWVRVVEGMHATQPAAWAYDELRWREQAIRPFLARDDVNGDLFVGRAWNSSRCDANRTTFGEFTVQACIYSSVSPIENERLPLAVTRFDASGVRLGTHVLEPLDTSISEAAEQVPFALAAHGGHLAVAGSVVRMLPDGSKRTYPDPNGFVDYDGYISIYDTQGQRLRSRDFNLGRGDVLTAMRWTNDGIVAVGAAGWDRWQGGMSISKGADPLFVWMSEDASQFATRVVPLSNGVRHWNLHDVVALDQAVVGYGVSDAPMTHSADGNADSERTFGPLQIRLFP